MGKNLKGKECGKDIYQRRDGLYHALFSAHVPARSPDYAIRQFQKNGIV